MENSLYSVTNDDLRRLDASEAVALISELLWAEATRLGIPIGKIHISSNVNAPDGGVDAKISDHAIAGDLIRTGHTACQIKSGKEFEPHQEHVIQTTEAQQSRYGTAASRWAGVGPYYAMFPTAFATQVVKEYTEEGDTVLDPFAGRATSLFAAASEKRVGLGVEINPVGWVYGKAKLQTASRNAIENRMRWLGAKASEYRGEAAGLPEFFHWCYCKRVREFLVGARDLLKWRRRKADWTTMALLMVDLHGKVENALSNQMRQTKAMSP